MLLPMDRNQHSAKNNLVVSVFSSQEDLNSRNEIPVGIRHN